MHNDYVIDEYIKSVWAMGAKYILHLVNLFVEDVH